MSVTIKDVAKCAGTSVSTVSKVINGYYGISEATVERVHKAMKDLRYYPNASAQNFATRSTKTVAVLANLSADIAFKNPHMFEIISGLEESLSAKGYRMVLQSVEESNVYEKTEELISRKSVDALAIHVSVITHPLSSLLTRSQFPHIVLGCPSFESQVCWIDNNNVYSGTIAASYLLSMGYEKIAFIGGQYYDLGSTNRLQGVKQALNERNCKLEDGYIWLGESTRDDGYRMAKQMLEAQTKPDAIICANNTIAWGCLSALRDMGYSVPDDIGVLTFDDYPLSQFMEPPLTIVDINVRDLGVQAGKSLLRILRHQNTQIQTFVTISNLVERSSTKNKKTGMRQNYRH